MNGLKVLALIKEK